MSQNSTAPIALSSHGPSMRIDKFLWYVRLAKGRSQAQAMAGQGIMRLNGRRIERAHSPVRVGDLVTLAQGDRIRAIRILALPQRRGPAPEAQSCYEELALGSAQES